MHADNARPHAAKVTREFAMRIFRELPASTLLARPSPAGCFLFGHLKNNLQGKQFGSVDELLLRVGEILEEISVYTLETVFREWTNRLDRCFSASQQMERTWNDVNKGPLSYS
jgi:hypothetical protein